MKRCNFFDKNLYFEAMRQLRVIGVVSGGILILQSILVPLVMFVNRLEYPDVSVEYDFFSIAPLILLIMLLMPLMAHMLFSFVGKRNASDFYHSFPVRRTTMYITYLAAVITWTLALLIIPTIVEYLLFLPMDFVDVVIGDGWYVFLVILVVGLLISAAVIIGQCITGTRFGQWAVIIMILFLPRAYLIFIREMVTSLFPVLVLDVGENIFWDETWNLLFNLSWSELRSIVYTFILALIYLIVGGVLFVRRKSEKAESVSINPKVQMLLRTLPALTCSFFPIYYILMMLRNRDYGISSSDLVIIFVLYIIAIVVYFLYELLTTGKLRMVIKAAPGVLGLFAANVLLVGFIYIYGYIEVGILPDADEITSVSIISQTNYGDGIFKNRFFDNLTAGIKFENEEINEVISEALKEAVDDGELLSYNDYLRVAITFNGRTIYRYVIIDDMESFIKTVLEDDSFYDFAEVLPEYGDALYMYFDLYVYRNDFGYSVADDAQDDLAVVYETLVEELKELDIFTQYELLFGGEWEQEMYVSFNINGQYYGTYIGIDEELTPKTMELINEYLLSDEWIYGIDVEIM